jgi:hypothetical protein
MLELIILALATAVRPTSLAAVVALLASASPRRVMTAYIAAGAAFTVSFGLIVILGLHGVGVHRGNNRAFAVAELVGGCVALVLGVLLLTGRIAKGDAGESPPTPSRWATYLNNKVTTGRAALAGPVTHLPGIFYLVALNLIVSHQVWFHTGLFSLVIYNAVWFSLPLAALAICVVNPPLATSTVGSVEKWAKGHSRTILLWVSFGVGIALLVDGVQRL